MFVDRLTKEQLSEFFEKKNLTSFMSRGYDGEEFLYVSVDGDSMSVNYRLYDFEGSTVSSETKWRRFLYKLFGEEYKQKYEEYLKEDMSLKLFRLNG